ncbi:MAG: hypothetical protein V1655_00920 [bacterium]
MLKKIIHLFRNFYLLLLIVLVAVFIFLGSFLKNYLYGSISDSQIVSIFKSNISLPNVDQFEEMEKKLEEKQMEKEINWGELKNPFKDTAVITSGTPQRKN